MKQLRTIRIILALLFLASSVAAILLGPAAYPVTRIARGSQVLLCSLGASAGASVVWLLFTLMFGRIYCATVCPAGTLRHIHTSPAGCPRLRRSRRTHLPGVCATISCSSTHSAPWPA